MSGVYIGVDGKARKIKGGYIGVDGVARKIKKAYIGVNGVAKEVYSTGKKLNEYTVGSIVYLNENGSPVEYLIVHHGNPDSTVYDPSCDGVWLLRKNIYESRQWHSSNNNSYSASTINSYLNTNFLGLFDASTQSAIKQVKIPYNNGVGTSNVIYSGVNGLSAKVFLLGGREVGLISDSSYFPNDGKKLDYFTTGASANANKVRVAYLNGSATKWWLRSPVTSDSKSSGIIGTSGDSGGNYCSNSNGVRPALILPSNATFDEETNTFKG